MSSSTTPPLSVPPPPPTTSRWRTRARAHSFSPRRRPLRDSCYHDDDETSYSSSSSPFRVHNIYASSFYTDVMLGMAAALEKPAGSVKLTGQHNSQLTRMPCGWTVTVTVTAAAAGLTLLPLNSFLWASHLSRPATDWQFCFFFSREQIGSRYIHVSYTYFFFYILLKRSIFVSILNY